MPRTVARRIDPRSSRDAALEEVRETLRRHFTGDELRAERFMRTVMSESWRLSPETSSLPRGDAHEIAFLVFFDKVTRDFFSPSVRAADAWRAQLDKLDGTDPRVRRAREALSWWKIPPELSRTGTWTGAAARFAVELERAVPAFRATPRLLALWAIGGGLQAPISRRAGGMAGDDAWRAELERREGAWKRALLRARSEGDNHP